MFLPPASTPPIERPSTLKSSLSKPLRVGEQMGHWLYWRLRGGEAKELTAVDAGRRGTGPNHRPHVSKAIRRRLRPVLSPLWSPGLISPASPPDSNASDLSFTFLQM